MQLASATQRPSCADLQRWLERARAGEQLAYHRGLLTEDRSRASSLAADERRTLAQVADLLLYAAEEGRVHLVQRRHGPFDFSYLAIKAGRAAAVPAVAVTPVELAAAA